MYVTPANAGVQSRMQLDVECSVKRTWLATAVALTVACSRGEAGAPSHELRLGSPVVSLGQLDYFGQIAELPDGRIVIPQYAGPVVIADLETRVLDTLGRKGDGPGEYRSPSLALARHGYPAVLDPMQRRLTLWGPDGSVDSIIPIPDIGSFELRMDTLGHLYAEQPSSAGFIVTGQEVDSTGPKDSTWIYRMHPPGAGRDTVARLHDIGWTVVRFKGGVTRMRPLYASQDQWGVLPDGSLWILRGEQNRVDRRSPGGVWTTGVPRAWTPIRTTDADRVYFSGQWIKAEDSVLEPMAETKGPFQDAVAAPDGEVWARLNTVTGDTVTRYALFPVTGPSARTVLLPKGRQVIAVTAKYVYAVHEDEDGFRVIDRMDRVGRTGQAGR